MARMDDNRGQKNTHCNCASVDGSKECCAGPPGSDEDMPGQLASLEIAIER